MFSISSCVLLFCLAVYRWELFKNKGIPATEVGNPASTKSVLEDARVRRACPCENTDLCRPITGLPVRPKEIFGFHSAYTDGDPSAYNWTHVTSIAWAERDPSFMCVAHSHGTRVIMAAPHFVLTGNVTERREYARTVLETLRENFLDGVTFDYELPLPANSAEGKWYAELIQETNAALKTYNPSYQVSVCLAWSADDVDGRSYPVQNLFDAADLVYIMDYDTRSQVVDACLASANAPYAGMVKGMQSYFNLGVDPKKIVLGVPWYGYIYECLPGTAPTDRFCPIPLVPFRGVSCSDAAGAQISLEKLLTLENVTAAEWDENMMAPWFNTFDGEIVRQVWYDDIRSLSLKYSWAKEAGIRGVGPYVFEYIAELRSDISQQYWSAFDVFMGTKGIPESKNTTIDVVVPSES